MAIHQMRSYLDAEDSSNLAEVLVTAFSLAAQIDKASAKVGKLEQELSELRDEISALTSRLHKLMRKISAKYPGLGLTKALAELAAASSAGRILNRSRKGRQEDMGTPNHGIERLVISLAHNGSACITLWLPEEVEVFLQPRLTELFNELVTSGSDSDDELISFQPRAEIAQALNGASEGSVTNLISRLRRAFRRAGLNDQLVQTRKSSYRLALRGDAKIIRKPGSLNGKDSEM